MRPRVVVMGLAMTGLLCSMSVRAHDPSEHMAAAQAPDCAAIQTSGGADRDSGDPVAQALRQQCMQAIHSAGSSPSMNHEDSEYDEGDADSQPQKSGTEPASKAL